MRFGLFILLLFGITTFGQVRPDVVLTTGHNDQINAMEITPNGRFLASASNDKQIKIWDLATGMEFRTLSGSDGRVEQLAFSADNKHLAGTSFNSEIIVWDIISGKEVYSGEAGSGRGLFFSKDGSKLYFIGEDATLAVLDMATLTVSQLFSEYTVDYTIDKNREIAYSLDHLGGLYKIDLKTGTQLGKYQLFDEYTYPFSNSDISPDGKYIAYGFSDDRFRILNTETGKFDFVSPSYESKIVCLGFDRTNPIVYIAIHEGDVILFDYKTHKIVERKVASPAAFRVQCLTTHPDGEIVLLANNDVVTLYDFNKRQVFKRLDNRVSRIYNMAYDPTGRFLAVATDKLQLKIWDLHLNRVVDSIQAFFPCTFTPDGKSIIAMTYTVNLGLFDVATGEKKATFDTNYELIQSLAVSKDGTKLAGAGFQNKVKVWEIESHQLITEMTGHEGGILALDFHPNKPLIVSGSLDETARVWDYSSGKELMKFTDQTVSIHDVKFSPDGNQLATAAWDRSIYLRNTSNWQTTHKLEGHVNIVNTIDYSSDGKVLVSGAGNNTVAEADNSVMCWDTQTGAMLCQLKNHHGEVLKVICDSGNKRFFSASVDGAIQYSDYGSCELIATYQAIGSKEFMIYTPDNYYIASKKALTGIAFRIGDKLVPFEQFDIHLNRPDIVATRINKSSPQLIKAYNYLYKKRLKKLNLDEGSMQLDFKLPQVINETKYDIVTTAPSQKLWIKAWDEDYNLQRINVYVNNVPIFGENGLAVPEKTKSIRKEIEIPLVNGNNKILLSCMNSNGIESLYESVEIYRDNDPEKHDLYIVTIGVSEYKDSRFNLKYPTKDAQDILSTFERTQNRYNAIYSKLLINENVTLENLKGLPAFFANCSHEDFAIIFIAGHGVLNSDYEYFYGTYDMDFDAPELRGLPYGQLSSVLSQIKAYQKLLVMDTCHSGELDKDELEDGPAVEVEQGDVRFRSAGAGVRKKEGIGADNFSKVTEDLFSDLRKGSGATVISSAGGAEYAMESDQWKNGLFTYVFLKGLTDNNDSQVYLSEIRAYVNQKVPELSNGKQIPTAREENISRDYIIFGN